MTRSLAQAPLPRPMAFVLGAGGSHGAVQVGQLRALHEHGVRPDFVVGSSVGALNAAMMAIDTDDSARRLDTLWRQVRARDLLCRTGEPALCGSDGLRRLLERHFPPDSTFDDLSVPLYALASEAATRRQHVLDSGPLLPALLASCAIPLLLPAVTIGGVRLVDGGIRHDLPIAEAFELGARSVLALPTTRWPRPIGYRSSAPVQDDRVVVLDGAVLPGTGWTFSRTDSLIERGYLAAARQLREEVPLPRPRAAV
jgi:NTE family protein